jgi:hypothetical protein
VTVTLWSNVETQFPLVSSLALSLTSLERTRTLSPFPPLKNHSPPKQQETNDESSIDPKQASEGVSDTTQR